MQNYKKFKNSIAKKNLISKCTKVLRKYEKYTTPLTIREMQMKITIRCHLTPVIIAIIKKISSN